jgi:outer membrane receptor for ferrienterochelin and colicins
MNYSGSISLEKKIANKYKINYDYSFFYNDVNNLITLGLAEDGNYTYINVGTFKSLGNQFNINLVSSKTNASMSLGYIGRYNKLSEIYQGINEFTFSPEFSLTLSYKCFKDIFRVNTFFKFNGLLQSYAVSAAEQISVNAQSAYSILDLSVSTAIFKKKLALILGLKNLLDVTEVDVIGTALGGAHQGTGNLNAARGRSVFISLKYNFSYDFKKN